MKEKHIDEDVLVSHLYGQLQTFMQGLEARDFDKLHTMAETNFVNKLKEASEKNGNDSWFKFSPSELDPERVRCVDKLFVRGVGVDRSTNDDQMDYVKIISLEKYGIRQFVHKYDIGMQDYFYVRRFKEHLDKRMDADWV